MGKATRTFKRENPFMLVRVQKIKMEQAKKLFFDFLASKNKYLEGKAFTVEFDGEIYEYFSANSEVKTFDAEAITNILIYDGNKYMITSEHFTLFYYGDISFSKTERIAEGWVEVYEEFKSINLQDCYPDNMIRPATPKEVKKKVNWYLKKGRFYYQKNKKIFCKNLISEIESVKDSLTTEAYNTYRKELTEIIEEKDMVCYYDKGNKKWTTNTNARIVLNEFVYRFLEDSFLEEFMNMVEFCTFDEIYQWISKNYNVDIMTLLGGE